MGHPDGAHTHGSGGGGLGEVLVILLAVALLGPAIAAAVAELVHLVLIVVAVLAGIAATGVVALAAFHVHRWRAGGTVQRSLPAPTAVRALQAPREPPPAIERPQEVHLHLHGVTLRTSPQSLKSTRSINDAEAQELADNHAGATKALFSTEEQSNAEGWRK
jgi:hypothetical protein